MTQAQRRDVLFAGYEFQQKIQRGIYLYTKSLIAAVKSRGHRTGILTESKPIEDKAPLLSNIYHSLNNPLQHRVSKRRMLLRYVEHRWLGRLHDADVPRNVQMTTEENLWFLQNVDRFLNVPQVYYTTSVVSRLGFEKKPLDLGFAANHGYDTIFSTSPLYVRSTSKGRRASIVQTVHDLIPLRVTMHWERTDVFHRRLKACAEDADLLLAVSEHTRNEFVELFPRAADKMRVVYQPLPADAHTIRLSEQPLVQAAVLAKFGLTPGNYCFYVGAIEGRKNIHRLIAAHGIVAKDMDCPLVLAGSVDKDYILEQNLGAVFARAWATDRPKPEARPASEHAGAPTQYIGYVTEVEKLCLLRNARFFAFPTLNEGFGIPVLEAQTLGCPVLTTNVSSLPEVVGDTAAMVQDPFNVEEIAVTIRRLMEDGDYRDSLRTAGLANARRFDNQTFADNVDRLLGDLG